jgi:hypothetical protein
MEQHVSEVSRHAEQQIAEEGATPQMLVPLVLVPIEPFGGDCEHPGCDDPDHREGIGLCDAVGPGWSDCNRAYGRIYRVEDLDPVADHMEFEGEQVRVQVLVREQDLEFFKRQFQDGAPEGRRARRCGHSTGPGDLMSQQPSTSA